ncbi:MAG: 2-amino-4-hydroxy-6-hydroxymethyldihydropteridine diphosphokinase, partial [Candidatus Aminicenantes bacterium]|nr:2-amino-4-hydroxy-6-hydroxymethyldihydropteridine diphosphokinase [Candidatus Aminicenantes bacterium]
MNYLLCLGSNYGDRKKNLEKALALMDESGFLIKKKSSIYETEPVGFFSDGWFYNQVVDIVTALQPEELLRWIKQTERTMGRTACQSLKPRVIDIDILFAGDNVIQTEELQIPHPRIAQRKFVLVPLS